MTLEQQIKFIEAKRNSLTYGPDGETSESATKRKAEESAYRDVLMTLKLTRNMLQAADEIAR